MTDLEITERIPVADISVKVRRNVLYGSGVVDGGCTETLPILWYNIDSAGCAHPTVLSCIGPKLLRDADIIPEDQEQTAVTAIWCQPQRRVYCY